MVWSHFRLRDGRQTTIDMSKVAHVTEHSEGTQIYFNILIQNSKNEQVFKSLIVTDTYDVVSSSLVRDAIEGSK
jgi:hypothetical protein